MSPFCGRHCADKTRLSRFLLPPPPKNDCVILQISPEKLTRQGNLFFFSLPTPLPFFFSFFFTQLEQFGSVLHAFLWPILPQSPVQDGRSGEHRLAFRAKMVLTEWGWGGEKWTEGTCDCCTTDLIPGQRDKGSLEKAQAGDNPSPYSRWVQKLSRAEK